MACQVDSCDPYCPLVPSELEPLFQPEIEAEIIRKAPAVRASHQLLLFVHDTEWKSRAILEKSTEQESPNWNWRPARGNNSVRRVPKQRSRLLGRQDQLRQCWIQ